MEIAINKKKTGKIIFLVIAAAAVLGGYALLNRNDKEQEETGIILEETPPTVDYGVVSPGFEEGVQLSGANMRAAVSPYQKIDGSNSLMVDFSGQDKEVLKIKKYIDGIYADDFYRLGFWAKASRDKEIVLSASKNEQNHSLRKFLIKGDGEARYFEIVFRAQNDAEDLIISAEDGAAARVWLDNFSVDWLDVGSEQDLENLQPTIAGATTWQNPIIFVDDSPAAESAESEEGEEGEESEEGEKGTTGDFFSRPGRRTGVVFQPEEELISGAVLKIQSRGNGGTGQYQLQVRLFDENLGIPLENIIANVYIDHGHDPETLEEIKKREQAMREELAKKEKAIAEGEIENDPTTDYYPDTFTQEEINKKKAEKRNSQLGLEIAAMKEEYNLAKEITVPLSARLDPQKKYWIGVSNEGVTVDIYNYLEVYLSGGEESRKMFYTDDANYNWKQSESDIWISLWSPEHAVWDGAKVASGASIVDLGAGQGRFRYALRSSDGYSFSGFHGRTVNDMQEGKFAYTDVNGYYALSREDASKDSYAVYKFSTFYPIEKIIFRNIAYGQSLLLDISYDGKNWEEIAAEEAVDSATPGQIPHLVVKGDGSREFYLRVSSQGNAAVLTNLEIEAELSI